MTAAIGHGRLGLATGRRTFDAWAAASSSAKRVHVEARPRLMVSNWALYSDATYVATVVHTFDGVVVAVTGVRHGLSTVPLIRAETLVDCVDMEGTFYFDANAFLTGAGGRWDDGLTHWDEGLAVYDQTTHLYVHLPDGDSPLDTQVAAELSYWWSNEGEIIPDFGAEKLRDGGFESWSDSETPTHWTTETNAGPTSITEDANELVGGFRSIRLEATGGNSGAWDNGVTLWDQPDGPLWDRVNDPLIAVTQSALSIRVGHMYRLSGAYRTDETNDAAFLPYFRFGIPDEVEFIESDGFGIAGEFVALPATGGEWRRFVLDFIGWTDSDAAELELRAWNGDAGTSPSGSVWFDDVRLRCIWRWVFAAPRLADVPPAQQSSRDVFFGGKSTGGGSLGVINADGKLEPELAILTWEGSELRFRAGGDFTNGERLLAEDYGPAFAGLVDSVETNDQTIVFSMRDAGEVLNVDVPPETYTQENFPDLPDGYADSPRPAFFGPKTGISPIPIEFTTNGYRVYELCDVTGAPAGIKSVNAVYAYADTQAADERDTARRTTLAAGTDYSTDLGLAHVTVLTDVRLYEVTSDNNLLDFDESPGGSPALTATLTPGLYTARELQIMAQAAIRAAGSPDNTLTYDNTTHKWTWARASGTLDLRRKTGTNKAVAAWSIFGATPSGEDRTGALTYTSEEATFEDADRQHVIRVDATGLADDSTGTYTGTPNAAIQLMPDIVRYLVSVIARRPEAVDEFTFREARESAPQILGLYLKERENLRDVLDRMEYSSGADIVLDGDGVFYVIVFDDVVPANVVDLFDRDYLSFTMGTSIRDVLKTITLKFDEDPSTGKFRTRETVNDDIALRYGRSPSREFETYLTDDEDAVERMTALAELASRARRIANVQIKGKLTRARLGTKVRLTRARAMDAAGRLEGDLFRIISLEKTHLDATATASMVEV
jgi:hypothetical protein